MNRASRLVRTLVIPAVLLTSIALGFSPADAQVDAAKMQFTTNRGICHTADKGASPRIGTNLFGVYGRPAGKASGFRYSSLFAKGGWKWDQAALDALITNAQVARPGTTMNYRQPDPKKRALIIQYLKKMR